VRGRRPDPRAAGRSSTAAAKRAARPLAIASDIVRARATEAARHGLRAVIALVERGEAVQTFAVKDGDEGAPGGRCGGPRGLAITPARARLDPSLRLGA
jgi:hypothetical protein